MKGNENEYSDGFIGDSFLFNGHCSTCRERGTFIDHKGENPLINSKISIRAKQKGIWRESVVCAAVRKLVQNGTVLGFKHHHQNSEMDARGIDITLLLPEERILYCQVKSCEKEACRFYRRAIRAESDGGGSKRVASSDLVILVVKNAREDLKRVAEDLACFIENGLRPNGCRTHCRKEICFCFQPHLYDGIKSIKRRT